jgi:hypothetical protein
MHRQSMNLDGMYTLLAHNLADCAGAATWVASSVRLRPSSQEYRQVSYDNNTKKPLSNMSHRVYENPSR